MTIQEIKKIHDDASRCIDNAEVSEALTHVSRLATELGRGDLSDELERLRMSYTFMLKYLEQGVMDPQRDEILMDIRESLYTINDQCYIGLQEPASPEIVYARRRELGSTSLAVIVEEYRSLRRELALMQEAGGAYAGDSHAILSRVKEAESLETKLFNRVWSSFPLSTDDAGTLKLCLGGDILPVHARCLLVSALLLGLMTFYDESKLLILLETYTLSDEPEVQLRALTCAMLSLQAHHKRAALSKGIQNRIDAMIETQEFYSDVWGIQLQLARSRNTENIKQQVRNDLIPNIMKVRPDFIDKLRDKDSPVIDMSDLEANPEWQEWLDQSGITKKIEAFNAMQVEGSDVFIATFANLKSFPFFKTLSNWFLPFFPAHTSVLESLGAGKLSLADEIKNAPFLCNSDKYSFCLSLGALPESQRGMMLTQVEQHNAAVSELRQLELPDERRRQSIITAYVQDLYRFFKLFSRRREFIAVMDNPGLDMTDCLPLSQVTRDAHVLELLGALYFKNAFYDDAIKCFTRLEAMDGATDEHIYQKIGFAYQNAGDTDKALTYYKRYELLHEEDVWNMRHIAACYRAQGKLDEALDYYRRAEAMMPDNVSLTLTIGHVLLAQNRTGDALQQYFKADLMEDPKHRSWRPIAWCSFLLSDYDRSLDYYDRIAQGGKLSPQDLLNRGHVLLCKGECQEAIATYRRALQGMGGDAAKFRAAFKGDALELRLHGVSAVDQALIPEAVCGQLSQG